MGQDGGLAVAAEPALPTTVGDTDLERATIARVSARLIPFLVLLFLSNWIDRTNLSIAALQMNRDLHFSATSYGLGAGIFFIGYALFEVPSNLILARVGARRWLARIAISWGLVASAMAFVRTPGQFYAMRFLLGLAEAGFLPGIIYYLSLWFPPRERGVAIGRFMIAAPLAGIIGNTLGGWVLGLDGRLGLRGWEWLFLLEGIPSIGLGVVGLWMLTDRPEDASWLSPEQRECLVNRLNRERLASAPCLHITTLGVLVHPVVWLLGLTNFLMAVPLWAYAFWAPLFVRDALHTTSVATGLIVGGIACLAAAALLLSGIYADRTGEHCRHAGAGALVAAMGCVGAALLPSPIGRVIALAFMEIGVRSYVAPFLCLTPMLLRGTAAAAGIALVNTLFSAGGFVGPNLMGLFKDATGSTSGAFLILAVLSAVAAALCLVLRRQPAFARSAYT